MTTPAEIMDEDHVVRLTTSTPGGRITRPRTGAEQEQALADAGYSIVNTGELESLETRLDEAQLRSIEARNPGIDMDEVRRTRALR